MKETLTCILEKKGRVVHWIESTARVQDALEVMAERRVGCVVVMDEDGIAGLFAERDLLRVLLLRLDPVRTFVGDVMSRDPLVVPSGLLIEEAMVLMTERRVRHIPVVDGGQLVGLVSIGDITKWLIRENDELVAYVTGRYPG